MDPRFTSVLPECTVYQPHAVFRLTQESHVRWSYMMFTMRFMAAFFPEMVAAGEVFCIIRVWN